MADLASFFAKKDKKKKSKRTAEITPEDLLKKIELDTQGLVDNGYDSNGDQPQKVTSVLPASIKDDEEWDEFEGEREVDLSRLKIQNLVEKEKERQEVEDQEELQKAVEESKATMFWNIGRKDESSDNDDDAEEEEEENKDQNTQEQSQQPKNGEQTANVEATDKTTASNNTTTAAPPAPERNVYVPPSKRNGAAASQDVRTTAASGHVLEKLSIKRGASRIQKIDVNSVDQFPSLGAAVQSSGGGKPMFGVHDGAGAFTSVKKGARNMQESAPDQKGLSTSNKYAALKSSRT